MSRKIIDCFTFYNELELLNYRLNILKDVVDFFIIVESTHTHVGKEKPLFYRDNKDMFKEFQHKIVHIVVEDFPHKHPAISIAKNEQWINERYQRTAISRGFGTLALQDQDVLLITDLDEIPDPVTLQKIKEGQISVEYHSLAMDLYYYNLQSKVEEVWRHAKAISYKKYNEKKLTCDQLRRPNAPDIEKGGWHLSYFGDSAFIKNKIEVFGHQEFNKPVFTDLEKINERVENCVDLYDRSIKIRKISIRDNKYLPPQWAVYLSKYVNEDTCVTTYLGSPLEDQYKIKSTTPSDINEHLPTLRKLAEECTHITEAGVRSVVSSYAFATALKGKAGHTLVQVDLVKSPNVTKFQAECKAEGVNTLFHGESDLTCPLADTDLFFIDTWHIYGHLKRELNRWHSYAKKYIVMHDTTVDEWLGETIRNGWNAAEQSKQTGIPVNEITKGLWPAIDEFLREHPEWLLEKRYTNNNGLTILKRRPGLNPWIPCVRPPVLTTHHDCAQAVIDFLLAEESPERILPVHIGNETVTQSAILYNTEQMTRADELAKILKTAANPFVKEVWDYSAENCRILAAKGIVAKHVPLVSPAGYVQQIKDLRKDVIYDVGFCGHVCWNIVCRRQVILNKLRDVGISVHFVTKYGLERDKELAKCRVMLNVHLGEEWKIFEQVRCDVWLRAGVPVISETSLDDDPRCINVPYNSIVETTVNVLKALRPRQPANDSLVIGVVHAKGSDVGKALSGLLTQTVDKARTHIVLASATEVPEYNTFDQSQYASVTRYVGNYAQEHIVGKALELGAHACFIESRHSLEPHTVQTLLDSKEKGVIAPMLTSQTRYSNYHTKVDTNGYCVDDPLYDDLLYKRVKGQIAVQVVNGTYFVHHKFLPQISYTDGTKRDSYVIMSDGLRKKGIPQYLDNRRDYGTIV
jgi:beta-1,4-mannosyl-glycoprotein beta-1,4-N-acetylglucosaminyltransferase